MEATRVATTLAFVGFSAVLAPHQGKQSGRATLRNFDRFVALEDSGDHSAAISLGDLDGDGNLDIVLSTGRHWESPIRLYLNDGKGRFKQSRNIGDKGYKSYG